MLAVAGAIVGGAIGNTREKARKVSACGNPNCSCAIGYTREKARKVSACGNPNCTFANCQCGAGLCQCGAPKVSMLGVSGRAEMTTMEKMPPPFTPALLLSD